MGYTRADFRGSNWGIYTLEHNGAIRYVGKTQTTFAQRYAEHLASAKHPSTPVARWIAELKRQGKRPVMKIVERAPLDLDKAERHWIRECMSDELLNVQRSGEGQLRDLAVGLVEFD